MHDTKAAPALPQVQQALDRLDHVIRFLRSGQVASAARMLSVMDLEALRDHMGTLLASAQAQLAALIAQAESGDAALTERQIQQGWEATFSTSNPFCPCDLKSFTKAVRWAEYAIRSAKRVKKQNG